MSPAAAGTGTARQRLAGDRRPAQVEVLGDVRDDRAAQPGADVVPAQAPAGRVPARVPAVAAEVGEVDAADEGDLVVDHDELLVVAVQEALARVDVPRGCRCRGRARRRRRAPPPGSG